MITIKDSPIHGKGLFSTQFIPKGTKITYFTGISMSREEFAKVYGKDYRYCCYSPFPWNPIIVSKEERNPITWCNEKKQPNCYIKQRWLMNYCDIEPDTELTLYYGKNYPRDYSTI